MSYRDRYTLEVDAITSGYDRKTCWVQARAGAIPKKDTCVVMTMQKLLLTGSDIFYELNEMRTDDGGKTWNGPTPHSDTLGRRREDGGIEAVPCDFCPQWHGATEKLLGTGHVARYLGDELMPEPRQRQVSYSVYDEQARTWSRWDTLEMPDDDIFFSCGSGSAQRWDCSDGTILLPVYTRRGNEIPYKTTVVRCNFDGSRLTYIEHGEILEITEARGLCEPSLTFFKGRYYLTMRNDIRGYVSVSDDAMNWSKPREWCFDHGLPLGNYNTQQHWATGPDALYLVYTRRAGWNDHVFRNRAPLFMAEVDTDSLRVKRNTERIVVPERGARTGNFNVTKVSEKETWVIVAEWMQSDAGKGEVGARFCEQYGSDNTVWASKIMWR